MARTLSTLVFALGVSAAAPALGDPPKVLSQKELDLAVYTTLMGSASGIDACTSAYLGEFPEAQGTVRVEVKVGKDGSVVQAAANTSLDGARNLRPCLEKVARGWRLPAHGNETPQPLGVTVIVKKGVKFAVRKPGEKADGKPDERPAEREGEAGIPAFNYGFGLPADAK